MFLAKVHGGIYMSYKIGSFNMFKFQAYLSDEEHKKEINKIARIIEEERFSVIALQEIFSEQAMKLLISRLGLSWEGRWCSIISLRFRHGGEKITNLC